MDKLPWGEHDGSNDKKNRTDKDIVVLGFFAFCHYKVLITSSTIFSKYVLILKKCPVIVTRFLLLFF